jgi:hypothetical protein
MDADELEIWRALNELPEVKAVFGASYTGDRVYILTVAAAWWEHVRQGAPHTQSDDPQEDARPNA